MNSQSALPQLIIFGGALLLAFAIGFWRKFSIGSLINKQQGLSDSEDDSQIMSFYTAGHSLARITDGQLNDMHFVSYMTTPLEQTSHTSSIQFIGTPVDIEVPDQQKTGFVSELAIINVLDLPFNTTTHLIGLSKQHKMDRLKFDNFIVGNGMERVVLEGDFGDYFDLYAPKGQQVNVRQVLNPAAMEVFVDYCRNHFWEVNSSELYFVTDSSDHTSDNIFAEAQAFVNKIKPALAPGDPGAPVVHHETSYGDYDGPPMNCPICKQRLTKTNDFYTCPQGHGALLTGRQLEDLRNHQISIPIDAEASVQHGSLLCPNCHNPLYQVGYDGGATKIYSCQNCMFRWLDASAIASISQKKVLLATE